MKSNVSPLGKVAKCRHKAIIFGSSKAEAHPRGLVRDKNITNYDCFTGGLKTMRNIFCEQLGHS
eukprot:scaffold148117_cov13-Prasinocladus_malaysianus.AAC.2